MEMDLSRNDNQRISNVIYSSGHENLISECAKIGTARTMKMS
jgi:hypothetical protein